MMNTVHVSWLKCLHNSHVFSGIVFSSLPVGWVSLHSFYKICTFWLTFNYVIFRYSKKYLLQVDVVGSIHQINWSTHLSTAQLTYSISFLYDNGGRGVQEHTSFPLLLPSDKYNLLFNSTILYNNRLLTQQTSTGFSNQLQCIQQYFLFHYSLRMILQWDIFPCLYLQEYIPYHWIVQV